MPLTSIITLERVFRTASRVAPFTNPLRFKKASGDEQRGWRCVRSEARIFAKPFSATGNFPSDQEPQLLPDQSACSKAGKRQWEKFLHSCRLWRTESGPRRMELFAKATEFCGSEPTARAKSPCYAGLELRQNASCTGESAHRVPQSGSKNSSSHIPITTCLGPCLAPATSSLCAC